MYLKADAVTIKTMMHILYDGEHLLIVLVGFKDHNCRKAMSHNPTIQSCLEESGLPFKSVFSQGSFSCPLWEFVPAMVTGFLYSKNALWQCILLKVLHK